MPPILEGPLETRGAGIVGKWEPRWFTLEADAVRVYDQDEALRSQALTEYALKDVASLALDAAKREITFLGGATKVRLRAPTEAEARRWAEAVEAQCAAAAGGSAPGGGSAAGAAVPAAAGGGSAAGAAVATAANGGGGAAAGGAQQQQQLVGVWVQCDTIFNLPDQGGQCTYAVRARWKGSRDAQETEERACTAGAEDTGLADCTVRQQVMLAPIPGQNTVLVSVMQRAANAVKSKTFGSCEIVYDDPRNQKPATHEILDASGEATGVTARLKLKLSWGDAAAVAAAAAAAAAPAASPDRAASPKRSPGHGRAGEAAASQPGYRRAGETSAAHRQDGGGHQEELPLPATPPQRRSVLKANRRSRRKDEEPFDGQVVNQVLDNINTIIVDHGLKVMNLFRDPQYNPSYLEGGDEELDADELAMVLARAGLDSGRADGEEDSEQPASDELKRSVRMLIRSLDKQGHHTIGIRELEAAIRERRRGKENWEEIIHDNEEKEARLNYQRPQAVDDGKGPGAILDAITRLLDERRIRVHDFFRHPQFNPAYLQTGDESLRAPELLGILKRAGLDLTLQDIQGLIRLLDSDGNGELGMEEFEAALRAYRRGVNVWETEEFKKRWETKRARTPPPRKASEQSQRLNGLYMQHQEKLQKLQQKRELAQEEEDRKIQEAREKYRQNSRALNGKELNANHSAERLYNDFRAAEHRLRHLQHAYEEEERRKLEESRSRPRSASVPRTANAAEVGKRLHALRAERDAYRKKKQEEAAMIEFQQLDIIGKKALEKNPDLIVHIKDKHHQLYEEAVIRAERLKKVREQKTQEEAQHWAAQSVGSNHTPMDPQRIQELHVEHTRNLQKRAHLLMVKMEREQQRIMEEAQAARSRSTPASVRNVSGRLKDHPLFRERDSGEVREKTPRGEPAQRESLGFGSKVARSLGEGLTPRGGNTTPRNSTPRGNAGGSTQGSTDGQQAPQRWRGAVEPVDHVLAVVNGNVALRSGCVPEDAPPELLRSLVAPMQAAMREFRDAAQQSDLNGEGAVHLRMRISQRLFFDGRLVDDNVGWHQCCEPDAIRQVEENLEQLMQMGERAHYILLSAIGPEQGAKETELEQMKKRWPKGGKWQQPRATKKAQFAYNPGPKTLEAAKAKALVRYGPTEGLKRHRHLLDIARVSLVFADATLLRGGLEQMIRTFEVVAVRNYYHQSMQSLLGDRYVDLFIVIKDPQTGTPHVCEVRLEEMCYFVARQMVAPHLEKICKTFREIYETRKCRSDPLAIEYLVRWTLNKPKDSHSLTVFRRHLARHYGSTVIAWRRALGNASHVSFNQFREVCQALAYREQAVEYWQELDCSYGGCMSLFDLDPAAVVLLAKLYAKLLGLVASDAEADVKTLFARLVSKTLQKQSRKDALEGHEFRAVLKPLGFSDQEASQLFESLDSQGGSKHVPPATVTLNDIAWLKKLPQLVHLSSALMTPEDAATDVESLRLLAAAEGANSSGRRARAPAVLLGRHSVLVEAAVAAAAAAAAEGTTTPRRSMVRAHSVDSTRRSLLSRRSTVQSLGPPGFATSGTGSTPRTSQTGDQIPTFGTSSLPTFGVPSQAEADSAKAGAEESSLGSFRAAYREESEPATRGGDGGRVDLAQASGAPVQKVVAAQPWEPDDDAEEDSEEGDGEGDGLGDDSDEGDADGDEDGDGDEDKTF